MGLGESDSSIDVPLSSKASPNGTPSDTSEYLVEVFCCKEHDWLNSHHDAILSKINLKYIEQSNETDSVINDVPTIENRRHKILWTEDSLQLYQQLVQLVLLDLQAAWLGSAPSSLSLLLQQTNNGLTSAAKSTQKVTYLRKSGKVKQKPIPPVLAEASCLHRQNFEKLKLATANTESTHEVREAAKLDHKYLELHSSLLNESSLYQRKQKFINILTLFYYNPRLLR